MIKNKTFYITYYATKHKKFITRKGKWGDKSRTWETKAGKPAFTYYDLDQDNYRAAIGGFKINYDS
tara:strand:- start:240 stop:437 length:198 start_codon:yes stop_codon:yes gene_type:complete